MSQELMTHKEIAEKLGITKSAVFQIEQRAFKKLKRRLSRWNPGYEEPKLPAYKIGDWIRWDGSGTIHRTFAGQITDEVGRGYEVRDVDGNDALVLKTDRSIRLTEPGARHERA